MENTWNAGAEQNVINQLQKMKFFCPDLLLKCKCGRENKVAGVKLSY